MSVSELTEGLLRSSNVQCAISQGQFEDDVSSFRDDDKTTGDDVSSSGSNNADLLRPLMCCLCRKACRSACNLFDRILTALLSEYC